MTFQTTIPPEKASVMKMGKKILIDQQQPSTEEDISKETQLKQEEKRVVPISAGN